VAIEFVIGSQRRFLPVLSIEGEVWFCSLGLFLIYVVVRSVEPMVLRSLELTPISVPIVLNAKLMTLLIELPEPSIV
jgi:hypothetical protein